MMKIGLIGAGYMMQVVHLPSLRAIDSIEIVAIADLDEALASRVARAFGIPRVYNSAEALVAGEASLDGVVVVTRKDDHAAACMPVLRRGIPILIEKPLDVSLESARELVATAERSGATLMVGYMKRFDPAVRELVRQLEAGAIGQITYAHLHNFGGNWTMGAPRVGDFKLDTPNAAVGPQRKPTPPPPDIRTLAFNEWLEVWIHDVNLARTLFGQPREIIFASNELPRLALIDFERGRALLEMGTLNYPGGAWDETLTIFGSRGRADLAFPAPLLFRRPTELVIRQPEVESRPVLADREAFTEEMIHFLDCIRQHRDPLTNGREALADLELCQAIVDRALPQ